MKRAERGNTNKQRFYNGLIHQCTVCDRDYACNGTCTDDGRSYKQRIICFACHMSQS